MYYFAYGSNLNKEWMENRCPETIPLGPAKLKDYKLGFRFPSTSWPGGGAADIISSPGDVVFGRLYLSNTSDFEKLDICEHVATKGFIEDFW